MNNEVINETTTANIIEKIRQCDDFHNRCDYLLEHDEATYLIEEIERLNKELDNTRLSELHKEYVINELEEWLKENIEVKPLLTTYFFKCDGKQRSISEIELEELKRVLNKLQDLKGSDKE